jgi:hypothetical protein
VAGLYGLAFLTGRHKLTAANETQVTPADAGVSGRSAERGPISAARTEGRDQQPARRSVR